MNATASPALREAPHQSQPAVGPEFASGRISRQTAAALNPLICDFSSKGTMERCGQIISALGYVMAQPESADSLSPHLWHLTNALQAALRYEAEAVH